MRIILRNDLSRSTYVTLKNGQHFEVHTENLKVVRELGRGTFGEGIWYLLNQNWLTFN